MRKYIYMVLLLLLCSARASAQFTLVSGTVSDTNGVAYSCATISASLINNNGISPTLNGVSFSGVTAPVKLGCPTDPTTSRTPGFFQMQLADNTQIKCGVSTCGIQTQWQFVVNSTGIPPPLGSGPQTCTSTLTVSGTAQTISLASCPVLGAVGVSDPQGGGTSTVPTAFCDGFLVKQGDFIVQNSTGNATGASFTLTWRMILTTGERREFQQTGLAPSFGNGPNYNGFPLVEGCLVGGSLYMSGGSVDSGQNYAQVFLSKNGWPVPNTSAIQLILCPLSSNYSVGWTGPNPAVCRTATDGQGFNQTITFANPAAGANLVNTLISSGTSNFQSSAVIGQKHWLANVRFTLATNATAQARQVCIAFKDANGITYYGYCMQATQAASLIINYDFTAGVGAQYAGAATLVAIPSTNVAATANEVQGTLPSNLQFSDATTISITVIGIQAGDQLSNIVVRTFWSHHVTD